MKLKGLFCSLKKYSIPVYDKNHDDDDDKYFYLYTAVSSSSMSS